MASCRFVKSLEMIDDAKIFWYGHSPRVDQTFLPLQESDTQDLSFGTPTWQQKP